MTAAVEILSGELLGRSYAVDEVPFSIGRKDDCAIVIPKKYFSRRHAEIVRKGSGFAIRGLSEKNPVILNDEEVEEHALADGDEFEICGVRFRFRSEGRGASRAEREVEKKSGVHASLGSRAQQSKTSTARRGRDARDSRGRSDRAQDLDDGPLDDGPLDDGPLDEDEATEQRRPAARGHSDLEDGDLPSDFDKGSSPRGGSRGSGAGDDLEDGPLPGEDRGPERFEFGGDEGSGSGGGSTSRKAEPRASAARAPAGKNPSSKADARGSRGAAGGSQAKRGGSEGEQKDSLRVDGAPGWKAGAADGPRGGERVVFGDDDAAAPAAASANAKKSKGSGSGDENERTDQLDISKLKKDDDPFAPDDKKLTGGKDPATVAAREKFLKALVGVGIAGIMLAGGIIYKISAPPEKKYFDFELGTCGVNETKLFNPPLNEDDPPEVDRTTPIMGAPTAIVDVKDAAIARIEWAVPSTQHVALFLVTGNSEGTTSFQLTSRGNVTTIYHVKVSGVSPHDLAKKKRQDALSALTEDDLKKKVDKCLSEGDQLQKEIDRNTNLTDKYSRQIFASYEHADEAFNVLSKLIDQSGVSDPTLKERGDRVRQKFEAARDAWEKERDHTRTTYVDLVNKADYQPALAQLKAYLNLLGDHCGVDYQRFNLILEKKFKVTSFKDPGCIEEEPR